MNSKKLLQTCSGMESLAAAYQVVDRHPEAVLINHLLCANPPKKTYKVSIYRKPQTATAAHRHMSTNQEQDGNTHAHKIQTQTFTLTRQAAHNAHVRGYQDKTIHLPRRFVCLQIYGSCSSCSLSTFRQILVAVRS